ncbi:MAG: tryptophan synthase subunit beta [Candidatus Muiribacteriaceae bacterium]
MKGRFGEFGGIYVGETLMPAVNEIQIRYKKIGKSQSFKRELKRLLKNYAGRPVPLTFCPNLSEKYKSRIYLKREDLLHTGAHKINNALGQALLAKHMGKKEIIAETGAGQHGVATATACARLGLHAKIFMGEKDIKRQELNVFKMKLLGAEVVPVNSGTKTLKDAINEALRYWMSSAESSYYLLGSVLGPHPYPEMVRDFQTVIGKETRVQIMKVEHRLPDRVIACVGGGSNAIGMFYGFLDDESVALYGVEAGGEGIASGNHAARFAQGGEGYKGIIHGTFTYILQDDDGQINNTNSVSAGLDYCAVGPEHSYLRDSGRARYVNVTDDEALEAFGELSRMEGIIPALESSHAVAYALKLCKEIRSEEIIIVNLSGRGDKDMYSIMEMCDE